MQECPQCGGEMENKEICPYCGFNFNSTLSCPYKISNKCVHSQKECSIYGLNYELCTQYLHSSGISK